MFRRLWTGLPDTPKYPADMEKLGYETHLLTSSLVFFILWDASQLTNDSYFVNEDDQIRNIKDPKYYFKYFVDKNTYYNDCHRFSFDSMISASMDITARFEPELTNSCCPENCP